MSESSLPSTESILAQASGEIARVMGDLVAHLSTFHAQQREADLATARSEAEETLRQAREDAETALAQRVADAERTLVEEAVARARAEAEALRASFEEAAIQRLDEAERAAHAREQALRAQLVELEARAAALEAEHATMAVATQAGERECRLASMERLLRSIVRVDECASLRGALDALGEAVAAEAPRSAVFIARDDALRAWCASGIATWPEISSTVACALSQAGPLGEAVALRQPVSIHAGAFGLDASHPLAVLSLEGHHAGLAAPVVVDGRSVALVYADDGGASDREVPGCWPEAVQVLARHAARCLESLTARRAATVRLPHPEAAGPEAAEALPMAADAESARRFARLVVSELKLYNEAEVDAGRRARDLRTRLAGPIGRARHQYETRVPVTLPGRDDYFEQELVRTLAEGDPAVLDDHFGTGT